MAKTNQNNRETPIKLVSECFVKPKHEIEASKTPYHLGPGDIVMLSIDPIQKGLLFTLNNNNNINTHRNKIIYHLLNNLKDSLSIALVYFYPLAGRFTTQVHINENISTIYIDCNKGPGARFIHASALDVSVDDVLCPSDVSIARPFFDLGEKMVNYDGHTKALLSIQVTELLDGVFIGFSMNHSVVDGTSFLHFVNMLSEIYGSKDENKTKKISRMPILNYRPWLSHDVNNKDGGAIKFPSLDVGKLICRGYDPGPLRERIFHFSGLSMSKLKAMANEECKAQNVISSFQALTAFVWMSITKARNLPLYQQTTCFLAVGARMRLDPPVSDDYFGNLISKVYWACSVEELLRNGLGWAAMNTQKHLKAHDGKLILDLYKELVNCPEMIPRGLYPKPFGETGVVMGGSARFDIYGPQFGLGRAVAARMGYGNKEDGKITANPGCEGGGSVDLEISLRPHVMMALEADEEFMSFVSC